MIDVNAFIAPFWATFRHHMLWTVPFLLVLA
jgi:hypothetical protein